MDKKSTVIKIGFMVLMFVLISNVMVIKTKADEYLGFNYYDKGSSTSTDSAKKEGVALDESAANNYLNNLDNIGFSERPLGSFCIFSADKIFKWEGLNNEKENYENKINYSLYHIYYPNSLWKYKRGE